MFQFKKWKNKHNVVNDLIFSLYFNNSFITKIITSTGSQNISTISPRKGQSKPRMNNFG
jgi:hypothetical protein